METVQDGDATGTIYFTYDQLYNQWCGTILPPSLPPPSPSPTLKDEVPTIQSPDFSSCHKVEQIECPSVVNDECSYLCYMFVRLCPTDLTFTDVVIFKQFITSVSGCVNEQQQHKYICSKQHCQPDTGCARAVASVKASA